MKKILTFAIAMLSAVSLSAVPAGNPPAGTGTFTITFTGDCVPTANEKVFIAGNFNDTPSWERAYQMDKTGEATWTYSDLAYPANFEFKFVIQYLNTKGEVSQEIWNPADNIVFDDMTFDYELEAGCPAPSTDTVDITVPNAEFLLQDVNGMFSAHLFAFQGCTADSSYNVYFYINSADFHAGIYPDSLINKDYSYIADKNRSSYTGIARGLTDPEITITNDEVTQYYNLTYSFVGNDSAYYNLDMTFQVPYEETWHESVASNGVLDKSKLQYDIHMIDFADSLYRYQLRLDNEVAGRDTLRFIPKQTDDTCEFLVYAVTDTNKYYNLYQHYSGWLVKTTINDSTYSYVGEIQCNGNKKFYINCKRPQTAIENLNDNLNENLNLNENVKFLRNGQFYIRKGEVIYDAKGARVE